MRFYPHFNLDMNRSPGFGSNPRNSRAFNTRFHFGSVSLILNLAPQINSPDRSTKSTTSSLNSLCVLVNIRFQALFHSPPGVLFTFPSQYYYSIGRRLVFRLGGWSPLFQRRFLVSAPTLGSARAASISTTRLSLSPVGFPTPFVYLCGCFPQPLPHMYFYIWFGLFRFRSPLLAESLLISLPLPT